MAIDFYGGQQQVAMVVDGRFGAIANPSLHLVMAAVLPVYGQCWMLGDERLSVVSVGSGLGGWIPDQVKKSSKLTASEVVWDFATDTMISDHAYMQMLGSAVQQVTVNQELGAFEAPASLERPLFQYERFDLRLSASRLEQITGRGFNRVEFRKLQTGQLSAVAEAHLLFELGREVAKNSDERLKPAFDVRYEPSATP